MNLEQPAGQIRRHHDGRIKDWQSKPFFDGMNHRPILSRTLMRLSIKGLTARLTVIAHFGNIPGLMVMARKKA